MTCTRRHAVVTGASSGIGRATALRLSRHGLHVFATVRRPEDGEALRGAATGELTPLLMDVTDLDSVKRAAEEVRPHVADAGLDALVNNAGVGLAWPMELVPLDQFRWQFAVGVDGQVAVTQAFLAMVRSARGRIVVIGSVGDRITIPFGGPLSAAKHALASVTEALRLELAPWNIRVVLVEPGSIYTAAVAKMETSVRKALQEFGTEGRALYGATFEAMMTKGLARERHGSPPEAVAAVVVRAIESRRPRSRYLVGKDARFLAAAAALPPVLLDALRGRIFGLPPRGAFAPRRWLV